MATQAPAVSSAATSSDPEHQAWLQAVRKYPVAIPHFEWTLEWMLSTPFPLHQFTQSPIVIEVKDRNPNADALLYRGPNVVGGYPHPETGVTVTEEVRFVWVGGVVFLRHGSLYSPPPTSSHQLTLTLLHSPILLLCFSLPLDAPPPLSTQAHESTVAELNKKAHRPKHEGNSY